MADSIPLLARLRFTDQLAGATALEMEDFQNDRKAFLRTALGGDVDTLEFHFRGDTVTLPYELTVAQAFELDLDPADIAQRLATQLRLPGGYERLLDQVTEAKKRHRAVEDASVTPTA